MDYQCNSAVWSTGCAELDEILGGQIPNPSTAKDASPQTRNPCLFFARQTLNWQISQVASTLV